MTLNDRFQAITHGRSIIRTPDDIKASIWADIKAKYPDKLRINIAGATFSLTASKGGNGQIIAYRVQINPTEYAVITGDCNSAARVHLLVTFGIVMVNRSDNRDMIIPNKRVTLLPIDG